MRSKQKIFCNACGGEMFRELPGMGREYKVCTVECLREMQWREACSLLGHEYKPAPTIYIETGKFEGEK
jgi:hypothetical protein